MNPAALRNEDNASAPVLYMALELSNKNWRLAFGDGTKRRQVSVPAANLVKLAEAVAKAKERFKMPASAQVVSCYINRPITYQNLADDVSAFMDAVGLRKADV